jgi:hypothetical protein
VRWEGRVLVGQMHDEEKGSRRVRAEGWRRRVKGEREGVEGMEGWRNRVTGWEGGREGGHVCACVRGVQEREMCARASARVCVRRGARVQASQSAGWIQELMGNHVPETEAYGIR